MERAERLLQPESCARYFAPDGLGARESRRLALSARVCERELVAWTTVVDSEHPIIRFDYCSVAVVVQLWGPVAYLTLQVDFPER